MKKISVANIVKYLNKSPKARNTFLANLKKPVVKKENDDETGGNYWVHSYSTVSRVVKTEDLNLLDLKVDIIAEKKAKSQIERSKNMFQRNIDILFGAKDFDFKDFKPYFDVKYLKNSKLVLDIFSVPIEVSPNHVYLFNDGEQQCIGAIWLVIVKDGYKNLELALFNYCLYHYLSNMHKSKYLISEKYCLVLDITNGKTMNYSQVLAGNYQDKINEELKLLGKAI
jgi:hypothetical protein